MVYMTTDVSTEEALSDVRRTQWHTDTTVEGETR